MGYMRHHAIIVTTYTEERIKEALEKAKSLFAENTFGRIVTNVMETKTNGYYTFVVTTDGSKEGWETSDIHDRLREEFLQWLNAKRFEDKSSPFSFVEVQYGDEDGVDVVLNSSRMEDNIASFRPLSTGTQIALLRETISQLLNIFASPVMRRQHNDDFTNSTLFLAKKVMESVDTPSNDSNFTAKQKIDMLIAEWAKSEGRSTNGR